MIATGKFIVWVIFMAAIYLITAFITYELSVAKWDVGIRILFAAVCTWITIKIIIHEPKI